jgi:hypothetical protein
MGAPETFLSSLIGMRQVPGEFSAQKAFDSHQRNASQRFGGSSGEVHVYDATGATIERKIVIDRRGQYQKVRE